MVFSRVWAGANSTARFGVTSDGTLYGWGSNDYGQLGNGSTADSSTPTPVTVTGALAGKTISQITGGSTGNGNPGFTIAVATDGTVYTWGDNSFGQLGTGWTLSSSAVPVEVTALAGEHIVQVAAGSLSAAAVASDGSVWTWGDNSYGELGDGTTNGSHSPVQVDSSGALAGRTITQIAATQLSFTAVDSAGLAYSWGLGDDGRLGSDTFAGSNPNSYTSTPIPVTATGALAGKQIAQIAAGSDDVTVLTSDGGLYAWGNNSSGADGDGLTSGHNFAPVAVRADGVLAGQEIVAIAAGSSYTIALTADGGAYAWGDNSYGQLGIGSTTAQGDPVQVADRGVLAGQDVTATAAGFDGVTVRTAGGGLYAWGDNSFGQLGDGTTNNTTKPAVALLPAVAVTVGDTTATDVRRLSSTTVSFTTPPHAPGTVDVIATAGGNASYRTVTTAHPDAFSYDRPPAITTTALPDAVVGTAYSASVTSTGTGTTTWATNAGQLPSGLTLDPTAGTITGTPTTPGTSTFTLTATNVSGSDTATYAIHITTPATQATPTPLVGSATLPTTPVTPAPHTGPAVASTTLPSGMTGVPYIGLVTATGDGPLTYTITSGALPAVTTLHRTTGVLTGTPKKPGIYHARITVTSPYGTTARQITIRISKTPFTLRPITATLRHPRAAARHRDWITITHVSKGEHYTVTLGGKTILEGTAKSARPFTRVFRAPAHVGKQLLTITGTKHGRVGAFALLTTTKR